MRGRPILRARGSGGKTKDKHIAVGNPMVSEEMDSDHHSSTPRFLPHHIKIMKVALAVAIIRQKPEGVCVRQYTERLALQFSQLQQDWREKALQLQGELLRTRQELTKFQIQAEALTHTNGTRGGGSDSDWQSSGYSSSAPTTSQELMLNEAEEQASGKRSDHPKTERIAAHIKFLSSVSSVLETRRKLSVLTESDLRTTVRDTIITATRGLSEVLESSSLPSLPPSLDRLLPATETIVEAVRAPRMRLYRAELVEACNDLLKCVITRISSHHDPEPHFDTLCSLVCSLSSIPDLYRQSVQQLVATVVNCAGMLTRSTQDLALLDVQAVETVANVFKTLEALCTEYDTTTLPLQVSSRVCSQLEDSILEISATYPLFTFSVWKLLAHLAPSTYHQMTTMYHHRLLLSQ